jgi:hypothetical protein
VKTASKLAAGNSSAAALAQRMEIDRRRPPLRRPAALHPHREGLIAAFLGAVVFLNDVRPPARSDIAAAALDDAKQA